MIITTLSDFRKDIKKYFDRVTENFDTLIINRGNDNGVVIISLAEYVLALGAVADFGAQNCQYTTNVDAR